MVSIALILCRTGIAGGFPATGQTSCYNFAGTLIPCAGTGQDGETQAGKALKYKNNGNGTVTDLNTLLIWEKQSDDGTIHDKDNLYTWEEGFNVHVAMLNNTCEKDEAMICKRNADCAPVGGSCGFAGKRDWRVPNVKELQSIINYGIPITFENPTVSPTFNTQCIADANVLTGSCTVPSIYGSSTSCASDTPDLLNCVWGVDFLSGNVQSIDRSTPFNVRAVRGGLQSLAK